MAATPVEAVLSKLDGAKQAGPNRSTALCPAHDDHNPSSRISDHPGAGCGPSELVPVDRAGFAVGSTDPAVGSAVGLTREQHLDALVALGLVEYVGPSPAGDPMFWPTSPAAAAALGDAGVVGAVATRGEV